MDGAVAARTWLPFVQPTQMPWSRKHSVSPSVHGTPPFSASRQLWKASRLQRRQRNLRAARRSKGDSSAERGEVLTRVVDPEAEVRTMAGIEPEAAATPSQVAEAAVDARDGDSDDAWNFLDSIPGWAMSAIASIGLLDAGYLLLVKLGYLPLTCPTDASGYACETVLKSEWASVGPVPLPLFGVLAYGAAAVLFLRPDWRESRLVFGLSVVMALASLLLLAILLGILKASCLFCAVSAFTCGMLLALVSSIQGRSPQLYSRRRGTILASVVMVGAVADLRETGAAEDEESEAFYLLAQRYKPDHPPVRNESSKAKVALARHLSAIGASCYSAWWCPHCQEQRENFGKEAVEVAPFVECCTAEGRQNERCKADNIDGYPKWDINGKRYGGAQPLARLAEISGFTEYPPEAFKELPEEAVSYIWQ